MSESRSPRPSSGPTRSTPCPRGAPAAEVTESQRAAKELAGLAEALNTMMGRLQCWGPTGGGTG